MRKTNPNRTGYFDDPDCPICVASRKAELEGRALTTEEFSEAFEISKRMGIHVGTGEDLMREENLN